MNSVGLDLKFFMDPWAEGCLHEQVWDTWGSISVGEAGLGVLWSPHATVKHQLPCWDHRAAGIGVPLLTSGVTAPCPSAIPMVCSGGFSIGGFT